MLLMIDNYDSFTYNLVQYFGELGAEVHVDRNDAITLDEIAAWQPERIVISPGPCTPDQAGISVALIERFAGKIPILGVCSGPPGDRTGVRWPHRSCEVCHDTEKSRRLRTAAASRRSREPTSTAHPYHSPVIDARVDAGTCLEITATSETVKSWACAIAKLDRSRVSSFIRKRY